MKAIYFAGAALAVLAQPAFAQDAAGNSKAGFRIEARAMYETPTIEGEELFEDDDDLYKLGSAFAFGGEAGFDLAVSDSFVVGPYVNYEKSTVESCVDGDCLRADSSWSAGAQLGFLVGTAGMVYGKIGYTELTLEADINVDGFVLSGTDSSGGIGGAIGFEQGFGRNLYGRLEGGYAEVGEIYGIDHQRRYAGVALGARF